MTTVMTVMTVITTVNPHPHSHPHPHPNPNPDPNPTPNPSPNPNQDDILEKLPELFVMMEIEERIDERTPYTSVFLQECERMNLLIFEMGRSLRELDAGLRGDLSISEPMEALMDALTSNRPPDNWVALAYPSLLPLGMWLVNLLERQKQLQDWTADLATPKCTWISGLFNPQAFLTAVLQVTALRG